MGKCIVVLSAGLDSTYNLVRAIELNEQAIAALTFNYGQKAAQQEIRASRQLCEKYQIKHHVIELPWFKLFSKSSLTQSDLVIPSGKAVNVADSAISQQTAKSVWVPNRNGIFLSIAAAFAEGLGAQSVLVGFNLEEAETFPDNSKSFVQSSNDALAYSTSNQVRVICHSIDMTKTQIVAELNSRCFDFSQVWPCYEAMAAPCGQCESCQRFLRALRAHDLSWPWSKKL